MIKPASTRAIEEATGASWQEWCAFLDDQGAAQLDHIAIVRKARTFREISGWWAQGVAVAYEQHIGRRKPGQRSDGLFNASVSRTIKALLEPAYASWCNFAASLSEIDGQPLVPSIFSIGPSSSELFVSMVKTTNLGKRHDSPLPFQNRSSVGRIFH